MSVCVRPSACMCVCVCVLYEDLDSAVLSGPMTSKACLRAETWFKGRVFKFGVCV